MRLEAKPSHVKSQNPKPFAVPTLPAHSPQTLNPKLFAAPTLPSFASLVECGIGGFDPSKNGRGRGRMLGGGRLAQSCIDLFDDCIAEVKRCTLTGKEGFRV